MAPYAAPSLPAWRSMLFVPATAEKFIAKAHLRGADVMILDLEDSIPEDQKSVARAALADAARQVGQNGADVCVRVNRRLDLAVPDIQAAIAAGATVLMLPKVIGPDHIALLSELVAAEELRSGITPGTIRFVAMVETAAALPRLPDIAKSDARLVGLGIGGEDLATEMEAEPSADTLYVPAMQAVLAARGAGLLPVGLIGAFADFADLETYRTALRRSRALGFACAACIHPLQVSVINEEYGPRPAEIERARRLIETFEAALREQLGSVSFEGAMIDLPVVERARRVLTRAATSQAREQG